ncbi:sensor histidine kinase [Granulibacter bethesdensis]|uniref:sensor histidine kinase n=1 Tax=Granulibacter bethesdensis TaxID=364410 RepID=UPI000933BE75|nr:sensor histidine kinase [Granulibacter bethesdensis]
MGLVLLAVAPVFVRAVSVEWSNYRHSSYHAELTALDTVTEYQHSFLRQINGTQEVLKTLSPAVLEFVQHDIACSTLLETVQALKKGSILWLAVFQPGQGNLCDSVTEDQPAPSQTLLDGMIKDESLPAYEEKNFPQNAPEWHVIMRYALSGQNVGPWLLSDMHLHIAPRFADAHVWLINKGKWAAGDTENGLPRSVPLLSLHDRQNTVFSDMSWSGERSAYGYVALTDQTGFLLGLSEGRSHFAAYRVFISRVGEFLLLVLCGLLAVWIATDLSVTRPLRRFTHRVMQWRTMDIEDVSKDLPLPSELRALSDTFDQAVIAVRQRENELTTVHKQQELLMMEIHHRVKNNLQIIASLLNLQSSRIRLPQAKAEFQSARDRVRALATLHRHLYTQGELQAINMRSFLNELCEQLFQAFGEVPGERIILHIEAPEVRMTSDQAVPLALIVTEVVSNAVKYAFPDQRKGSVLVRLTVENDDVCLVIQDDGVGLNTAPIKVEADMRDGLGRQLIKGFSRQLGAALDVSGEDGTRYELRVRLRNHGRRHSALEEADLAVEDDES